MGIQDMEVESAVSLESHTDDVDNVEQCDELVLDEKVEQHNDEDLKDNAAQSILAPYVGMKFSTHEDAYNFYNAYALKMGFGIRRNSTNNSRTGKGCIARTFVCNKEGYKKNGGSQRDATRTGCLAKMKIIRNGPESWKVSQFVENHNGHELTSPSNVSKYRSHKRLHRSTLGKNLVNDIHDEGPRPSKNANVLNRINGSQNDSITPQQCHDHPRVVRKNNMGRECIEVIKHFQKQRLVDPDFYFAVELDYDHTFRSVFWADGRSRASYLEFGDVIVFDVTYRINKFSMPFAPFTGVNHHRQSILFGCTFLADEKENTFVWLFQEWLNCMRGKAPKAIIADQDIAICNAIERVFPETRHIYCKWHLDKHIIEHMVHLKRIYGKDIRDDFQNMQYSNSMVEAERYWKEMKEKYNFEEGSWMADMWNHRHRWIPCFLKDVFLASMKTSKNSEIINSFFNGFVNSQTPWNEFIVQYDEALASRRDAEENADFKTLNSKPGLIWEDNEIEGQAGKSYTRAMFKMFQHELKEGAFYWTEKVNKQGNVLKYLVGPSYDRSSMRLVTFDDSNGMIISCECAKFEMDGILCSHALKILHKKRVVQIPDHYILKRWTMKARYWMFTVGLNENAQGVNDVSQLMMRTVHAKYNKVLRAGYKSITIFKGLDSYLSSVLAEIEAQENNEKSGEPVSQIGSSTPIPQMPQLNRTKN